MVEGKQVGRSVADLTRHSDTDTGTAKESTARVKLSAASLPEVLRPFLGNMLFDLLGQNGARSVYLSLIHI